MAHKVRLIASDLDGTLLLNGAQALQAGTPELIHRITTSGIIFLAASGRQYANLQRLFAPVKSEIGYLCENGCLSFLDGEMLSQEFMPYELGQELIREIKNTPGAEVAVSGVETTYIENTNSEFYHHLHDVVHNNVHPVNDIFKAREPYMKISMYEKGGLQRVDYWKEKFGDKCTVVTGGSEWLDCMPKGVHKGLAIKKILERLNIDPEDVIAFGDNENDREMLLYVGCPITMESARPDIRAFGKYTTDTVEHALERILDGEGYNW